MATRFFAAATIAALVVSVMPVGAEISEDFPVPPDSPATPEIHPPVACYVGIDCLDLAPCKSLACVKPRDFRSDRTGPEFR